MEMLPLLEYTPSRILKSVHVRVFSPDAEKVAITGDFSNWHEEGQPLSRGRWGIWYTTIKLLPGDYQYRLRIDNQWADHDDAAERVPNLFGGENCILSVEG